MNGLLEKYIQNWKSKNPALDKFAQIGFPTKSLESWKYTDIVSHLDPIFAPHTSKDTSKKVTPLESRIVFINGFFSKELSSIPQGIEVAECPSSQENLSTDDSFELLNLGLAPIGIELKIPKNFESNRPLEIFHIVTESAKDHLISPRIKINAGPFSKINILEVFEGEEERYFTNSLIEINLDEGSSVEYVKAVNQSLSSLHVGKLRATCERNSNFKNFTIVFGGKLTRNNIEISLLKEGAESIANGVYALSKNQICDNFTLIDHLVGNTTSNQLFKGILDEESHGIFTGKIRVFPDAQKINSNQMAKNLLLSKKAHINARPILEINADDVKCSHGAAIGQLNPEEIFYMETRGIPKDLAQRMLCLAFALDGIDLIGSLTIKNYITELLLEKLKKFDVGHFNEKV